MNATKAVERVRVMAGDRHVVSQVGLHLLGELADRARLTSAYSAAVPWTGERAPGHDRGRVLTQVAVMRAGGGQCVADMAALRDQAGLFGAVASAPTIWRAVRSSFSATTTASGFVSPLTLFVTKGVPSHGSARTDR